MMRPLLRAAAAVLVVALGALLVGLRLEQPVPKKAAEVGAPQAAPAPAAPAPGAPGAGEPAARPPWSEQRLATWLGESWIAAQLVWALKLLLILLGVGCLVNEVLKQDRLRHGHTPSGWGPWSAPGASAWPTVVAEPMQALSLGVLFPLGVQLVLTGLFPPKSRPVGDLEFGIAAVTLALLPPALLVALRRLRLGPPLLPRVTDSVLLGLKFACIATLIVVPVQLLWGLVLVKSGQRLEVQNVVQIFAEPGTPMQPWLIAIFGVLVAPFTEEGVFRGLLYPSLRAKAPGGPFGAAVIVALLFALIHGNLMAFVPLFTLALVLAWVMERTNSLLACVVVHAVHNAASLAPMVARLLDGGPASAQP
jgi:membrane protease YdiL (CAAX protease family)